MRRSTRRTFLSTAASAAVGLPFLRMIDPSIAAAGGGAARRLIVFYFPDGVVGPSQDGEPTMWHCSGSEHDFDLSPQLEPLAAWKDECLFFNGLTMGGTDSGSHPGGAKKLLTATDGGNGESIDQLLARTVGADAPFRHLYLGAMANHNNASGDKHISYPSAGTTITPEDDPRRAFDLLFSGFDPDGSGEPAAPDPRKVKVIEAVLDDMGRLRNELGNVEAEKLDLHLAALEEVERRIKGTGDLPPSCDAPSLDTSGWNDDELYVAGKFPAILRAQIDLMVLAMSCELSRVGVLQGSHHTSELIMSQFPDTAMYDPSFDMRSHQASHYGASHNPSSPEFSAYLEQRRWWVEQFAYLLEQLSARPDPAGGGTMLDTSLVLLCSEVCDGNTHLHDNMPFVLAGRGGGAVGPGRLLQYGGARHADLLIAIAHAMGENLGGFGDNSSGPLSGVLS